MVNAMVDNSVTEVRRSVAMPTPVMVAQLAQVLLFFVYFGWFGRDAVLGSAALAGGGTDTIPLKLA